MLIFVTWLTSFFSFDIHLAHGTILVCIGQSQLELIVPFALDTASALS